MSKLLWVLYFLCLTGGLLQNFAQLLRRVRLCLPDGAHQGLAQVGHENMGLEQKAVTPAAFASTSMSDQS